LKSKNDDKDRSGAPVEIKPVSFRPASEKKRFRSFRILKWLLGMALGAFLILLCASAWFVFTARQVVILIEPTPDRFSISGGITGPKIGAYYLIRPGDYVLDAFKKCYQPLRQNLPVTKVKQQSYKFDMTRQPGILSFQAHQADVPAVVLADAAILIDGQERGRTPLAGLDVQPGRRSITVRAENYQAWQSDIEVEGCGKVQQFDLALIPAWAEISLQSEPRGATVKVDGKPAGSTPLTLKLPEGDHELEVEASRYKAWHTRLAVIANQPQNLETIRLQPADAKLAVQTKPAGANVMLGKTYAGQTPLKITLAPDKTHRIQISKAGYQKAERVIKLHSEESKTLSITLKPKLGMINFVVKPSDAELYVDGRSKGRVPAKLQLAAVEHKLEIRRQGYRTYQTRITPRPGFPQEINIALTNLSAGPGTPAGIIRAKNGYELKLIQPGVFSMGSSRREQGRRSNETLRKIKLQREFYMGAREVTNKEVREFLASHNSGSFKSQSLNPDQLPAVGITWEQAALFCNWLSIKESLKPVYVQKGGRLIAADPVGNGYRLPTEAEWEYCARFNRNRTAIKYSWGNGYPPPANMGNFADVSAKNLITNYLPSYNDRYAVSSPPAKFEKNALGLYDMGGNVAEWCHDNYSIYSYSSQKVYNDPMGPKDGKHHVIKGSSWMQAGISELRLSYRDYSDTRRPDLGFRIARYAK
jgi:formylglycine-generating enzyme required for sulfatase activity